MSIPVQNIYYLLCYAWNHVQEQQRIETGGEEFRRMADMLGHVLTGAVSGLLKAGLDRSYVEHASAIYGVRGKLGLSETLRRQLLWSGRTFCHYDEFSHDILPNHIIKATLRSLLRIQDLDTDVRAGLRGLIHHMRGVSEPLIHRSDFAKVRIHRNNRGYDFVLRLCRLIYENVLVDRSSGRAAFHDFRDDEARMGQLFEDFLLSFFRREQRKWSVLRWNIQWDQATGTPADLERLPIMRTDIVLQRGADVLVMDAKYYKEALVSSFGREKVRSGHLYQIFTYIENLEPTLPDSRLEGMLLYPVVNDRFAYDYRLHGHRIRVASVDLDQSWKGIHSDLLGLLEG